MIPLATNKSSAQWTAHTMQSTCGLSSFSGVSSSCGTFEGRVVVGVEATFFLLVGVLEVVLSRDFLWLAVWVRRLRRRRHRRRSSSSG